MPNQPESFEAKSEVIPSEETVVETLKSITGGAAFTEANRVEVGGKLKLLEVFLVNPDQEGNVVKLDYSVSKSGVATIDVAYFDADKGFDFRPGQGYDPQDITGGFTLGEFKDGVWTGENLSGL